MTFASEGHFNMFCNKVSQWLGISVNSSYSLELQVANSQAVAVPKAVSDPVFPSVLNSQVANSQVPDSQVPKRELTNSQISNSSIGFSQQLTFRLQPSQNVALDTPFTQMQSSQAPEMENGSLTRVSKTADVPNVVHDETGKIVLHTRKSGEDNKRVYPNPSTRTSQPFHQWNNYSYDSGNSVCNGRVKIEEPDTADYLGPENETFRRFLDQVNVSGDHSTSHSTSLFDTSRHINSSTYDHSGNYGPNDKMVVPTITENDLLFALDRIPEKKRHKKIRHHRSADPIEDALLQTIQYVASQQLDSVLDLSDEQLCLKISRRLQSSSFARVLSRLETVIVPSFETSDREI